MVFGEAHSCAGKFKVFSSEVMLLSLKIINLKGSCFWLGENIEFYNENSNFKKKTILVWNAFDGALWLDDWKIPLVNHCKCSSVWVEITLQ